MTEELEDYDEIGSEDAQVCEILDIYWERIFLHVIVKNESGREIYLRSDGKPLVHLRQAPITQADFERLSTHYTVDERVVRDNLFGIELNMAAAHGRRFLENAKWEIGYYDSEEPPIGGAQYKHSVELGTDIVLRGGALRKRSNELKQLGLENTIAKVDLLNFCTVEPRLASRLDELDKIYRYDGTRCAYTVNFTVFSNNGIDLNLNICSYFMKINPGWKSDSKRSPDPKKHRREERKIAAFQKVYNFLNRRFPHDATNILFLTETSESISGNLKCVYDRMLEREFDTNFNIMVSTRRRADGNIGYASWFSLLVKVAKADIIIVDNYVSFLSRILLASGTKFVQLWHAGAGFKGVGFMRFGKEGSPFPNRSVHKEYTLALAPSESLIRVFEEVFGIEREAFLPVGMPRLDGYLDASKVERFKESFYEANPELKDKKIVLFAPTYRGAGQKTAYYDYSKIDFNRLYDFCGSEYVLLVKMHPFIRDKVDDYKNTSLANMPAKLQTRLKPDFSLYAPRIFDFTEYSDINELFYITDIFITDYSSAYYEYSIHRRPLLFYTYDRVLYENVRNVYQKIHDSAPGKVCDTFEELMEALETKDYEFEKTLAFSESHFPDKPEGATDKLINHLLFPQNKAVEDENLCMDDACMLNGSPSLEEAGEGQ